MRGGGGEREGEGEGGMRLKSRSQGVFVSRHFDEQFLFLNHIRPDARKITISLSPGRNLTQ